MCVWGSSLAGCVWGGVYCWVCVGVGEESAGCVCGGGIYCWVCVCGEESMLGVCGGEESIAGCWGMSTAA